MLEAHLERIRKDIRKALDYEGQISADESRADGKLLRKSTPRSSHAAWQPSENRPNPVELLKEQAAERVPELVPIRYERMSATPFTFYRGAALIMASDLSCTPSTGIEVQCCGDAHISNFGLFESPERRMVFDINDFDETARGPWEWDVKRLATSVEICGRDRAFSEDERSEAVLATVASYRQAMQSFAEMGTMEVHYAHYDIDTLYDQLMNSLSAPYRKTAEKLIDKAKGKNSARAVQKLTEVVVGQLRIVSQPPLIVPVRELVAQHSNIELATLDEAERERFIGLIMAGYRKSLSPERRHLIKQYRGVDIARKVVGVGSVGTRAWIIVMQGAGANDPLVLQVKQAQESVLERFVGKSAYQQHGKRVVEGQRAMQTASDILLGWTTAINFEGKKHDYYVRQLWDGKGSIDLDVIDADSLTTLAKACGWTLAHAHARTGNRFALAGYLGKSSTFDEAILQFSKAYADQNEEDYRQFMAAYKAGTLTD